MKRTLFIPLLLSAAPLLAQPAGVSVSLTAPTTQNVGLSVALTAKVRTPGFAVQLPGSGVKYETSRFRYTFKANRTWPCAVTKTLAENVLAAGNEITPAYTTHIAHYIWTPPAADAGEYTFSVDVTYLPPPPSRLNTSPPTLRERPQAMGTATTSPMTTVKPTANVGSYIKTTFYPPSPAPAPVNLTLTASVPNGPEYTWYRYKYTCSACVPPTQTKSGVSVTFQIQIPNQGNYIFPMTVDKVQQIPGQSGCIWQGRTELPHTDPAYYYVTAP